MRELADLIQRSNGEAIEMLNKRFAEAMDEVKALAREVGQARRSDPHDAGHPDVVIIGGGVVGSAIAYFLRRTGAAGSRCSSATRPMRGRLRRCRRARSGSNISCPVNIALSRFGIEFLRRGRRASCGRRRGAARSGCASPAICIWPAPAASACCRRTTRCSVAHDVAVALLDAGRAAGAVSLADVDGVVAGSLGLEGEGWFDGPALMQAFRRKARALGAEYRRQRRSGSSGTGGRSRRC